MRKRIWSHEEILYLIEHFQTSTRVELSEALGIPLSLIARKVNELGLKKRREPPKPGEKINRLTIRELVLRRVGTQMKTFAVCECECGRRTQQLLTSMMSGRIKSCGCWKNEKASENATRKNYKHGRSDLKTNRLYRIWSAMKTRCYNETCEEFRNYGGRGITVCDEWRNDYLAFEGWSLANGYQDNLSIDRVDVNGNYCPENCRWASRMVQAANRRNNRRDTLRVSAFGERKTIGEWLADERCLAKSASTICYRIGSGWSPEEAISTPSQRTGRRGPLSRRKFL